jgi:hypothetical protein
LTSWGEVLKICAQMTNKPARSSKKGKRRGDVRTMESPPRLRACSHLWNDGDDAGKEFARTADTIWRRMFDAGIAPDFDPLLCAHWPAFNRWPADTRMEGAKKWQ